MNAPFIAWFAFEMFHRISDINVFAIDPGFFQRAVQDFSGGTDEWFPSKVFVISGLFADQHDWRILRSFAKNRPRSAFI